jgi:hypothetical protein
VNARAAAGGWRALNPAGLGHLSALPLRFQCYPWVPLAPMVVPHWGRLGRVLINAQTLEGLLSEANRTYCAHSELFRLPKAVLSRIEIPQRSSLLPGVRR